MLNRKQLATEAVVKALRLRKQLGVPLNESISALDAAEKLDIEVRLIDLPSMEGMYVGGFDPKIILSSLRPQGRRSFTCAHEIGHHVFKHGEQFDELTSEKTALRKNDPKEYSADCFAAYFLMPKVTVDSGMMRRGFTYQTLQPIQVYSLASWLGVGYRTLVNHLRYGLDVILHEQAQQLLKLDPRSIRQRLLGRSVTPPLHVADTRWIGRAIDCEVGDYLLVPKDTLTEGAQLVHADGLSNGTFFQACTSGIGRVFNDASGWSAFVRVSRRDYVGRSCFRFEEEVKE